jgi:hypothetical protein
MKGFISKALVTGAILAGLSAGSGCYYRDYWDLVDPCWPEHYNCDARGEVMTPRVTQATNGLVLEQTVWNYHFKEGTDQLLPAGQTVLDHMARRRPMPVGDVFLQTAHDLGEFDPAHAEQFVVRRADLDAKRMKAIQAYLGAARPDVSFNVSIHDPGRTGLGGVEAATATFLHNRSANGSLRGGGGQDVLQQLSTGGAGAVIGQPQQPTAPPAAPVPGPMPSGVTPSGVPPAGQ